MPDTRTCLCCGVNLDGTTKAWCDYCFVGLAEDGKHTCKAEPAPEPRKPDMTCTVCKRGISEDEPRMVSQGVNWHAKRRNP